MPEYRIKTVLSIDTENGMPEVNFLLEELKNEYWEPIQLYSTVDELAFELTYESLRRS